MLGITIGVSLLHLIGPAEASALVEGKAGRLELGFSFSSVYWIALCLMIFNRWRAADGRKTVLAHPSDLPVSREESMQ